MKTKKNYFVNQLCCLENKDAERVKRKKNMLKPNIKEMLQRKG